MSLCLVYVELCVVIIIQCEITPTVIICYISICMCVIVALFLPRKILFASHTQMYNPNCVDSRAFGIAPVTFSNTLL